MEGGKVRMVLLIALIVVTIANYATANAQAEAEAAHKYVTASATLYQGLDTAFQNFKACLDQCPHGSEACFSNCAEANLPKNDGEKLLLVLKARFEARLQFCTNGCEVLRECQNATGDAQVQCSGGCTNFCTKVLERDQGAGKTPGGQ